MSSLLDVVCNKNLSYLLRFLTGSQMIRLGHLNRRLRALLREAFNNLRICHFKLHFWGENELKLIPFECYSDYNNSFVVTIAVRVRYNQKLSDICETLLASPISSWFERPQGAFYGCLGANLIVAQNLCDFEQGSDVFVNPARMCFRPCHVWVQTFIGRSGWTFIILATTCKRPLFECSIFLGSLWQ